ncbi:MAG: FHA domain-containing protein [Dehalococcoidia bacterium]
MKGNKLRGFLKLASGVLLAIALIVTCSSQVNANSVPGLTIERAVPLLLPNTPTPITSWGIYLLAGLLVVAVAVIVIGLLLMKRRTTARKTPARLGMPPTMPPPTRPATTTPPVDTTPQPSQPVAAATFSKLLMPDNTEVPLSGGIRFMGRTDFERIVPPDRASYISRDHFVIGFASGSYYIEDAGSGNGTKLNGRKIEGIGSQWLRDGDQIDVAGVVTLVFKTS